MAWPGDQVQQMVIAKLSLRLSLTNPSNIWHCSKEICHKSTDREREKEKEKGKENEKGKEKEKESEGEGTTGSISLIGFARSVNVHNKQYLLGLRQV